MTERKIFNDAAQLRSAIQDFQAYHDSKIVIHGTAQLVSRGDIIVPNTSHRPARRQDRSVIDWNQHPPFIFAGPPEYSDVAVFHATIYPYAPPYTAGKRVEDKPNIVFMANPEVITDIKDRNPLGTVCILSDRTFTRSPQGSWLELVSEKPTEVLEAFYVYHAALSFSIEEFPPLSIPGISSYELTRLRNLK